MSWEGGRNRRARARAWWGAAALAVAAGLLPVVDDGLVGRDAAAQEPPAERLFDVESLYQRETDQIPRGSVPVFDMSADGRIVVFEHDRPNEVGPEFAHLAEGGHRHVFVHDRDTGETWTALDSSDGKLAPQSWDPDLSASGDWLTFVTHHEGRQEVALLPTWDRGAAPQLITLTSEPVQAEPRYVNPSVTDDGHVVFATDEHGLAPEGQPSDPATLQVYRWRGAAGIDLVSRRHDGAGGGNGSSYLPSITPLGGMIAFQTEATDLVEGFEVDDRHGTPEGTEVMLAPVVDGALQPPVLLSASDEVPDRPLNGPSVLGRHFAMDDYGDVVFRTKATVGGVVPAPGDWTYSDHNEGFDAVRFDWFSGRRELLSRDGFGMAACSEETHGVAVSGRYGTVALLGGCGFDPDGDGAPEGPFVWRPEDRRILSRSTSGEHYTEDPSTPLAVLDDPERVAWATPWASAYDGREGAWMHSPIVIASGFRDPPPEDGWRMLGDGEDPCPAGQSWSSADFVDGRAVVLAPDEGRTPVFVSDNPELVGWFLSTEPDVPVVGMTIGMGDIGNAHHPVALDETGRAWVPPNEDIWAPGWVYLCFEGVGGGGGFDLADDQVVLRADQTAIVDVLANDAGGFDPATLAVVDAVGVSAEVVDQHGPKLAITPLPEQTVGNITYEVSDGSGTTDQASVHVLVGDPLATETDLLLELVGDGSLAAGTVEALTLTATNTSDAPTSANLVSLAVEPSATLVATGGSGWACSDVAGQQAGECVRAASWRRARRRR